MTKRAWILVATAYVIGGIGLSIALAMIDNQQDSIEEQTQELAAVTGLYCEVLQAQNDTEQARLLFELAGGGEIPFTATCRAIVERVID